MGVIWVICGSGRHVGKTHLARRLCECLPRSVYVKCGSGRPRRGRPGCFVRTVTELRRLVAERRERMDHVLVEHNASALSGLADVVVYLDGLPQGADVRKDAAALKRAADIVIAPPAARQRWSRMLRKYVGDRARRAAVCDLLENQLHYLCREDLAVQTKVWLSAGGEYAFGAGLVHVLENVDRFGTLRAAAEAAHMSYRHAWNLLRRAEKRLGHPLIDRRPGGRGGGRSRLSDPGRKMLDVYVRLRRDVGAYARRRFEALYGKAKDNGG